MKELTAIDITKDVNSNCPVAYVRISPELRKFLQDCDKKHGVLGFIYDGKSLNLGVVLEHE